MKSCNYNKDYTCKLCGKIYKGNRGLGLHLSKIHIKENDIISIQEYFDKYVIINIDEKYCKECKNENIFQSLGKGIELGIEIDNGDVISYYFNNKLHKYYVDFKIKDKETGQWRLIEIKRKHKWFRDELKSGKLLAKVKSAQEFSKNNNYLPYKMLFNDNY